MEVGAVGWGGGWKNRGACPVQRLGLAGCVDRTGTAGKRDSCSTRTSVSTRERLSRRNVVWRGTGQSRCRHRCTARRCLRLQPRRASRPRHPLPPAGRQKYWVHHLRPRLFISQEQAGHVRNATLPPLHCTQYTVHSRQQRRPPTMSKSAGCRRLPTYR
jgi:hypothetical protein